MKKQLFSWFGVILLIALISLPSQLSAGWEKISTSGFYINMFAVQGDMIVVATDIGAFTSIDGGGNWNSVKNIPGLDIQDYREYTEAGEFYFAHADSKYIYVYGQINDSSYHDTLVTTGWRSQDRGASWEPCLKGWRFGFRPVTIAQTDSTILVGGEVMNGFNDMIYPIYRSSDQGRNFVEVRSGLPPADNLNGGNVYGITFHKGYPYLTILGGSDEAGWTSNIVYTSSDMGIRWKVASYELNQEFCLLSAGDYLFIGHGHFNTPSVGYGVTRSKDRGITWEKANNGLPLTLPWGDCSSVSKLVSDGKNIFACLDYGNIFVSTDYGDNWSSAGTNFIGGVRKMLAENGYLYVFGSEDFGSIPTFWRRKISDMVTGVSRGDPSLPLRSDLSQNYPNPFNPATTIGFTLRKSGLTTLKVYDILGREVAVLINEVLTAGSHQVKFDGRGLSSGLYIYTLTTQDFTCSHKMILQK